MIWRELIRLMVRRLRREAHNKNEWQKLVKETKALQGLHHCS